MEANQRNKPTPLWLVNRASTRLRSIGDAPGRVSAKLMPTASASSTAQPPITHTSISLTDKIGLRFDDGKRKKTASAARSAALAPAAENSRSKQAEAAAHRKAALNFWLDAAGCEMRVRTVEHVECTATLVAADAAQEHLVVKDLTTPMGTYPNAQLRTGDLLSIEFDGRWTVDGKLPPRPPWLDAPGDAFAKPPPGVRITTFGCNEEEDDDEEPPPSFSSKAPAAPPPPPPPPPPAPPAAAPAPTVAGAPGSSVGVPAPLQKYYIQRYMLFSRFDLGCALDEEGWYSVTPEVVAQHMAERCRCDIILDAFCGVGGNAIHFAHTCSTVLAVDLDASRLRLARHNASVYEVDRYIEWLNTDFFALSPAHVHADVVFLSPPWGGPEYQSAPSFDMVTMMGDLDGAAILEHALRLAPSVAYFLPKNTDISQIEALALAHNVPLEIERCSLNGHEKGLMAYFGFEEDDEMDDSDGRGADS